MSCLAYCGVICVCIFFFFQMKKKKALLLLPCLVPFYCRILFLLVNSSTYEQRKPNTCQTSYTCQRVAIGPKPLQNRKAVPPPPFSSWLTGRRMLQTHQWRSTDHSKLLSETLDIPELSSPPPPVRSSLRRTPLSPTRSSACLLTLPDSSPLFPTGSFLSKARSSSPVRHGSSRSPPPLSTSSETAPSAGRSRR